MRAVPSHSGEMTQGSGMATKHPTPMTGVDPIAQKSKRAFNSLSASAIGLEFGVSVIVGILFGRWLDGKLGTAPWLMIVGVVLGFAAGVIGMVRGARRAERAMEHDGG